MMWEVVVGLYVGPRLMGSVPSEGIRRLQSLSGIQIPRVIAPSSNACHSGSSAMKSSPAAMLKLVACLLGFITSS